MPENSSNLCSARVQQKRVRSKNPSHEEGNTSHTSLTSARQWRFRKQLFARPTHAQHGELIGYRQLGCIVVSCCHSTVSVPPYLFIPVPCLLSVWAHVPRATLHR